MADPGGKGSLKALIVLNILCCGGLLLAAVVLSFGGLMAFFENPVVQVVGVALVAVAVWALVRHRAGRGRTGHRARDDAP